MITRPRTLAVLSLLVVTAACTDNNATTEGGAEAIEVTNTDEACTLSTTAAPSGTVTFDITNDGSKVTEFYVLEADGETVRSEAENIGAGITRSLTVTLDAGDYVAKCVPGMSGDGIVVPITITQS